MDKEEVLFQKRLQDLAKSAYIKGRTAFTDFLSMNELTILHGMDKSLLDTRYDTFGGYGFAERQMAMFVPDAYFYMDNESDKGFSRDPYPISLLKISPLHNKFAEELSHRDYLGALLNLGVDRCKIGDIIVHEKEGYVYCHNNLVSFFMEELKKVRHTLVQAVATAESVDAKIRLEEVKGTVASLRIDSILSVACRQSRTSVLALFQTKKIYVNGKLTESNSLVLKEGDIVSVRGYGRFIFEEVLSVTKKDRYYILLKKYV